MKRLIEIDGSRGEGGGSVVRLSTALATTLGEPIRIYNIRIKRDNPGLRPQHLMGLRALAELCNGNLTGDEVGSKEIKLDPGKIQGGDILVEIETAGSICLVLQTLMIPAAFSKSNTNIKFRGGATDTFFAPPIDYLKNVTLPMLRKMGYIGEVKCVRRGHYPKGGAIAEAKISPIEKLKPIHLEELGEVKSISGRSHCAKLPGHIAKRQAESAEKYLENSGYKANIGIESYEKSEDPHIGPGTGITLWTKTENGAILGTSSLGKKGKSAEVVGEEAAKSLIKQIKTGCSFDLYLTDQIIPYMALAEGKSVITGSEITSHTLTNVKIAEEILRVDFDVKDKKGQPGKISVEKN